MLDRAIPALMGSVQIKQKTGGVIGVLYRVQHIRQLEKPVHMPFGVHLHTACINTVLALLLALTGFGLWTAFGPKAAKLTDPWDDHDD